MKISQMLPFIWYIVFTGIIGQYRVLFPFFDVVTEELVIPVPIETLKTSVDSIMINLDKKINEDSVYFHLNLFNHDEMEVLDILMLNSKIWIDDYSYSKCKKIEDIKGYNQLRDWYNTNKDCINWFYYAELAMEDMGYHLKRDSTGVYVERDTTLSPLKISTDRNEERQQ